MSGRSALATSTVSLLLPGAIRTARAVLVEETLEGLRFLFAALLQERAAFIFEGHQLLEHFLRSVQRGLELAGLLGTEARPHAPPVALERPQLGLDAVDLGQELPLLLDQA